MISQHALPQRHDISATSRRRSFWMTALLGLPALNVAILVPVAFVTAPFDPAAALLPLVALGLVELAFLIAQSPKYRIGRLGALAAMVGNVVITAPALFLVGFAVLVIQCETGTCPLS